MARNIFSQILVTALGMQSIYQGPPRVATHEIDSPQVESARENLGGQISPPIISQTRWYHADIEAAIVAADRGQMAGMARLWRACRSDGIFAGVLSTRTQGLVRLPIKFSGPPEIVAALEHGNAGKGPRSTFFEMCPPGELAAFACDIIGCDLAVAELLPVQGRDFPVFVRRDPEALIYIWAEDRWYFRSVAGLVPINPGDGRWVLYTGSRVTPWHNGIWRALGRAYIDKEHSRNYSSNWQGKLANPARVAEAPEGASDESFADWFRRVAGWGSNTVFATKPGYKVSIVESNGIGWQSFEKSIGRSEREGVIAIAGQEVTTTGGTGFANADIHKAIRADLIKATADALAYAINTQVLPMFVLTRFGEAALAECPTVAWDVEPPKEAQAAAQTWETAARAITSLATALKVFGLTLDAQAVCQRFGVPLIEQLDAITPTGAPANEVEIDVDLSAFEEAA